MGAGAGAMIEIVRERRLVRVLYADVEKGL